MKKIVPLSLLAIVALASANEPTQQERPRYDSVKKAVGSVSQAKTKDVAVVDVTQEVAPQQQTSQQPPRDRHSSVKKAIGSVSGVEPKEIDIVYGFNHMFRDGKVTGQIRSMYNSYNYTQETNTYATALGGFVKYELAEYKGLSAGVTFHTATDIDQLSGDGSKRDTELSSSEQEYEVRSETYLNYRYGEMSVRLGRQIIDTPLADSDDIRMIPNSFEALIANYETQSVTVMLGHLQKWQGGDAGLDDGWQKTGEDGTNFGGITVTTDLLEGSFWVYNINGETGDETANNTFYGDVMGDFTLGEGFSLHTGVQYLKQNELDNSGVKADIWGASGELVYKGLGINLAYNGSSKHRGKQSFSGFGGGTLFTSMDSMILDAITSDRSASAVVGGFTYEWGDFNLLYAYGDFQGDANSQGEKEHIVEQDFGVEYSKTDDYTLAAIYTRDDDKYNNTTDGANGGDWGNVRVYASYNF
jgi:hypothetical protein